jgi:hypothetical protein
MVAMCRRDPRSGIVWEPVHRHRGGRIRRMWIHVAPPGSIAGSRRNQSSASSSTIMVRLPIFRPRKRPDLSSSYTLVRPGPYRSQNSSMLIARCRALGCRSGSNSFVTFMLSRHVSNAGTSGRPRRCSSSAAAATGDSKIPELGRSSIFGILWTRQLRPNHAPLDLGAFAGFLRPGGGPPMSQSIDPLSLYALRARPKQARIVDC